MPVDCGSTPRNKAQAATAASAAVPPARIASTATRAAAGCDVATIAFWAWTVERPAKWKFLIARASFSVFLATSWRPAMRGAGLQGVLGIFIPRWAMAGMPAKAPPMTPGERGNIPGFAGFRLPRPPDKRSPRPSRVAASYQSEALPDFGELREPLRAIG